jgi:hypothetical protein
MGVSSVGRGNSIQRFKIQKSGETPTMAAGNQIQRQQFKIKTSHIKIDGFRQQHRPIRAYADSLTSHFFESLNF